MICLIAFLEVYVIIQKTMSPRKSEKDVKINFINHKGKSLWRSLVKILKSSHCNIFGINWRCSKKIPIKKNNEWQWLWKVSPFSCSL